MIASPQLDAENELFWVLKMVDNYYIKGDTLSLNKAKMATLAKFAGVYFH
jgi:copper homeostasis protein (lipoprotein)